MTDITCNKAFPMFQYETVRLLGIFLEKYYFSLSISKGLLICEMYWQFLSEKCFKGNPILFCSV